MTSPNKGGRPRTIESLALINGQKGTQFYSKLPARSLISLAGDLGIKIRTEKLVCFPTAGLGIAKTITRVTITYKPLKSEMP